MSRRLFVFSTIALLGCGPVPPATVTLAARQVPPAPATIAPPPAEPPPCHTDLACLEREAAKDTCEGGSSPSLALLELAVVRFDTARSATDVARARKLLAPCFRDESVLTVLAHADARESNPKTPPFGSCDAFAVTTLASTDCLSEHLEDERAWLRARQRTMDAETARLFDAANAAFETYATDVGAITYAMFDGGSRRNPGMQSVRLGAMLRRHRRLAGLPARPAADPTDGDATEPSAAMRTAIAEADRAWPAYRAAEMAYFGHVHAGSRAALGAALAHEHAEDLRDAIAP